MDDSRTARALMRRHLVAIAPDDPLGVATDLLRLGRMRGVPVLERGRLVGELTTREVSLLLIRALGLGEVPPDDPRSEEELRDLPVRGLMSAPRAGVRPETPLAEVARRLAVDAAGYLPVVTGEGQLLGIVTESDLLRAALTARGRRRRDQS